MFRMMRTIIFLFYIISCSASDERPELIDKLRGLGMEANPIVSQPSNDKLIQKVRITVYSAIPSGHSVTIEKYADQVTTSSGIQLDTNDYDVLEKNEIIHLKGLDIVKFFAEAKIPPAKFFPQEGSFVRLGFKLKSSLNIESVVGSFLVVPEGYPDRDKLSQKPNLEIVDLSDNQIFRNQEEVPLNLQINEEKLKVGWFVSGGKITNRRSKNTFWKNSEKGSYALIATVRDVKTRAFSILFRTINFE